MLVALGLIGCGKTDHAANAPSSEHPVAVGAYYPIVVSDDCKSGGKLTVCTTETLLSVDEIVVENPDVVQVLRMRELPQELQVADAPLAILGVGPGRTKITIQATFDDDSKRSVELSATVMQANRLELLPSCENPDFTDDGLFPASWSTSLVCDLYSGSTRLSGLLPDALVGGEVSLVEHHGLRLTAYQWQAPSVPESVKFTSPRVNNFSDVLRVYSPAEANIETLTPVVSGAVPAGFLDALLATIRVGDEMPCVRPNLVVTSRTPTVCTGPEGEITWTNEMPGVVRYVPLLSDTCVLDVSAIGSENVQTISLPIDVTF